MGRKYSYVRKTNRQNWCKEEMRKALEAVQRNEMGWLKASKTFNIPASTLRRHALGMNKLLPKNQKGMGKYSSYNALKYAENNVKSITSTENEIVVKEGSSTDHIETEIIKIENEFLDYDGESLDISTQDEDIFAEEEDTIQYVETSEVSDQEPTPNQTKKEKQSSDKVVYNSAKRRKYVRKTYRQTWSKEAMKKACEAVQRGEMGWLKASKAFNIPASTIRRHALKNKKGTGRYSFYNPLKDAENNINRITSTENEITVKQGSSTDHIKTEIINIKNEFFDCDGESVSISTPDEEIFTEEEDTIQYLETSEVSDQEFDIFGRLVSVQLKKMPLKEALRLQMKVCNLMANFRIELFSKMSNEDEAK